MNPIAKNFAVESFYSVARGRRCAVTFFGIYTNCQLAAYAFQVATERISQMTAEYQPAKKKKTMYDCNETISTKSSRLSYALGMVNGISKEVDNTLQREKEKKERKLQRAQQAATKGCAYEESDDDDDDDDD